MSSSSSSSSSVAESPEWAHWLAKCANCHSGFRFFYRTKITRGDFLSLAITWVRFFSPAFTFLETPSPLFGRSLFGRDSFLPLPNARLKTNLLIDCVGAYRLLPIDIGSICHFDDTLLHCAALSTRYNAECHLKFALFSAAELHTKIKDTFFFCVFNWDVTIKTS